MENEARQVGGYARQVILRAYGFVVDVVVIGLVALMLLVLLYSFVDVVVSAYHLVPYVALAKLGSSEFRVFVENVLEVFVVIELFSVFMDYVRTKHVRISNLLDVAIVFVLREMLVKLYAQKFSIEDLIGLCIIALVLVIARSIAYHFRPSQR